jgi:hypothetical protein
VALDGMGVTERRLLGGPFPHLAAKLLASASMLTAIGLACIVRMHCQ